MQLVIDIPDNYDSSKIQNGSIASKVILNAVANGVPLPKGHGRLIDADALIHWHRFESKSDYDIANAPTIIESDKGESEG